MAELQNDFESVEESMPIGSIAIPALNRSTLARFAGAIDRYNPVHLDDKVAKATGRASVFAPATLVVGYIGRLVQGWAAGASLRTYGLRMTKPVWPGDVLTCRGAIRDKRSEGRLLLVGVDVRADNQRGEMVATGRFIIATRKTSKDALSKTAAATGFVIPDDKQLKSLKRASKKTVSTKSGASKKKASKKTTTRKKTSARAR